MRRIIFGAELGRGLGRDLAAALLRTEVFGAGLGLGLGFIGGGEGLGEGWGLVPVTVSAIDCAFS